MCSHIMHPADFTSLSDRSFSFDDLDDMVNGGNRKARGHREDYAGEMVEGHAQDNFDDTRQGVKGSSGQRSDRLALYH